MPELPEVEVITRGLQPHLLQRKILTVGSSNKQLRYPVETKIIKNHIIGREVTLIHRRAKYIYICFDNDSSLVIHLGMTGNLGFFPYDTPKNKHDHFWLTLDNDQELRYNDTRRFGSIRFIATGDIQAIEDALFKNLGPEPLSSDFDGNHLNEKSKHKKLAVKNFIMDNRTVVGVGNIYANESLFLAGIAPDRAVNKISKEEWQRLGQKIKDVLHHAIKCGGSTINDFVNASQQSGYFQINFKVYGKDNSPCTHCDTPIKQIKIGGRASFYCPNCQN